MVFGYNLLQGPDMLILCYQFALFMLAFVAINGVSSDLEGNDSMHKQRPEFCFRGQYLDLENGACKACPLDHFMPDDVHTQIRCYPCYHARPDSPEIDLVNCTDTSDTIIGCKDDWFLQIAPNNNLDLIKCYSCTKCNDTNPPSYEIRACGAATDTVCCPLPNMLAVRKYGNPAYSCQHRFVSTTASNSSLNDKSSVDLPSQHIPNVKNQEESSRVIKNHNVENALTCGPDYFLKIGKEGEKGICEKCPDGWHLPQSRHTNIQCLPDNKKRGHENASLLVIFGKLCIVLALMLLTALFTSITCHYIYHRKFRKERIEQLEGSSIKTSHGKSFRSPVKLILGSLGSLNYKKQKASKKTTFKPHQECSNPHGLPQTSLLTVEN